MTNASAVTPLAVTARGWGWRHASRRAWAVSGVDLRIEPGERVLLLGASGAGKSTFLHALAGVLSGHDDGEEVGELRLDGLHPRAQGGRVGMVLQDPDAQTILSRVGDDVAFGCENLGVPRDEIWSRVGEALDAVGLDVPLDRSTSALSGGQKQRLALAGVLAMRPGLVLLDEPTANLDPGGVGEVRTAVGRMLDRTDATLVVVEHRVDVWLPLVDRVVVLGPDGVVADGDPTVVFAAEGARLAAAGVWVPGHPPRHPAPPAAAASAVTSAGFDRTIATGELLISARELAVARVRGAEVAAGLGVDVRAGRVLAVVGPNGAGKSTLALTLAGLLPPHAGSVVASPTLAAGAPGSAPIRWSSRDLLTRIGTVFQEPEHQILARTVRGELEIGPRALGLPDAEVAARVDVLLARLRLDGVAAANPYTLSGGEKRRLTVAAMLATRPRMLVLDEPTFGQDARTWEELVALLAELRDDGAAVVTVTHDLEVARALHADEFVLGGMS